jgi:hypothetical protein
MFEAERSESVDQRSLDQEEAIGEAPRADGAGEDYAGPRGRARAAAERVRDAQRRAEAAIRRAEAAERRVRRLEELDAETEQDG